MLNRTSFTDSQLKLILVMISARFIRIYKIKCFGFKKQKYNFDRRFGETVALIFFPGEFTDLDIIANAILLFSAGTEPVSITTSLFFYELAMNKDIQDTLRAEIISAKEKYDGKITSDFLSELQFADMALNGK